MSEYLSTNRGAVAAAPLPLAAAAGTGDRAGMLARLGKAARARRGRVAGVAVVLAGLLGGAGLVASGATPAYAASGLLSFYWNADGTSGWNPTALGTTFNLAPAIVRSSDSTEIAATASNGSLYFFWNKDGTSGWNPTRIAVPGSVISAPAMVRSSDSTEIVAASANGGMDFFWNVDGTSGWNFSTIPAMYPTLAGQKFFGTPAIVRSSDTTEVAATSTGGDLYYFWNTDGTSGWNPSILGWNFTSAPAIVRSSDSTEIVAARSTGLGFYWNADGTDGWTYTLIPIASSQGADDGSAPAIVRSSDSTEIVSQRANGSLLFFWNADGTSGWSQSQIAGPGSAASGAASGPAVVRSSDSTEVAAVAANGDLMFYWNKDYTSGWNPSAVPGATASGTPAIVRSSDTTEIASDG